MHKTASRLRHHVPLLRRVHSFSNIMLEIKIVARAPVPLAFGNFCGNAAARPVASCSTRDLMYLGSCALSLDSVSEFSQTANILIWLQLSDEPLRLARDVFGVGAKCESTPVGLGLRALALFVLFFQAAIGNSSPTRFSETSAHHIGWLLPTWCLLLELAVKLAKIVGASCRQGPPRAAFCGPLVRARAPPPRVSLCRGCTKRPLVEP